MNLKAKSWMYGIGVVVIVLALNFIVLAILNFPIMAMEIIKKYFYLLIPLIGGLGLQVGLFTYYKGLSAITCSTSVASGGISGVSMILCCSHYLLNILPFLGAIVGISTLSFLTKYTPHFFILGIVSNAAGIGVIYYQKNKYSRRKNEK